MTFSSVTQLVSVGQLEADARADAHGWIEWLTGQEDPELFAGCGDPYEVAIGVFVARLDEGEYSTERTGLSPRAGLLTYFRAYADVIDEHREGRTTRAFRLPALLGPLPPRARKRAARTLS
jgi:hypothetical protein